MSTTDKFKAIIILVFLYISSAALAQKAPKSVLGYPAELSSPDDRKLYYNASNPSTRSKVYAWLVVSDRDDNPVYDNPSGTAFTALSFGQSFFVLEEQSEWIKIARPYTNGLKIDSMGDGIQGWVPKSNMLLWTTGLVDPLSKIHRKVVLLNRAEDINNVVALGDKLEVDLYRSPSSDFRHSSIRIHDFYFVYKHELNRVLIGKSPGLTEFDIDHNLIGWIPENRTVRWDNRICLEPNYYPEAFEERRNNPELRVKAFGSSSYTDLFCSRPDDNPDGMFWNDDPAGLPARYLASDGRRFKGNVLRMPMLGYYPAEAEGAYYYESGVVGTINIKRGKESKFSSKIDEITGAELGEKMQEMAVKSSNINVFFIIEGTDPVYEYQSQILEAVRDVNQTYAGTKNIRYGALIYRDIPEASVMVNGNMVDRMTELFELSPDLSGFISFLENTDFSSKTDTDDWTAMYYGVSEAIKKAGFKKNQLNMVFMLGCFGDFRANKFRKEEAANTNHPALIKNSEIIVENLSELDVNLYAIQLRNDGLSACRAFTGAAHNFIYGSAQLPYNMDYANPDNQEMQRLLDSLKVIHNIEIREPFLEDPQDTNIVVLENAIHPGFIIRPGMGKSLGTRDLVNGINKGVSESVIYTDNFYQLLSKVYSTAGMSIEEALGDDDFDVAVGRFWPALAKFLEENLDETGRKNLEKSLDQKYRLFVKAYVPGKIKGAQYPAVTYSLCMPFSDLNGYISVIDECMRPVTNYPDKRRALYQAYIRLAEIFSGESVGQKNGELQTSDVFMMMQGLYKSAGDQFKNALDFDFTQVKIKDILDERIVNANEVDLMIKRFATVKTNLEKILSSSKYEFMYDGGSDSDNKPFLTRIYWIPLKDVF